MKKGKCTGTCTTGGSLSNNQNSEQAIVQTQDAQWYQPISLDPTLGLMKQLKGKNIAWFLVQLAMVIESACVPLWIVINQENVP